MNSNNNIFNEVKQNETNINKPNLFFSENNTQQDNQSPKKFKFMFEDDDDDKKMTFKKDERKNPVADKRLSFLFDDD